MIPSTPVTARLACAAQPAAGDFPALREAGYGRVINLAPAGMRESLPDEQALVEASGLAYTHIPIPFQAPEPAQFAAFLEAMDAAGEEKVFLHCIANYRASAFAALYGFRRLGWERPRAEAFIARIWQPNPAWRAFLDARFDAPPSGAGTGTGLEGRVFRTRGNSPNGEVSGETRFRYHEEAGRIWGEYAGGGVDLGRLSGRRLSATEFEFSYRHVNAAGEARTGECLSVIEAQADGHLRIRERWRWTCGDHSAGESEIEEVPD